MHSCDETTFSVFVSVARAKGVVSGFELVEREMVRDDPCGVELVKHRLGRVLELFELQAEEGPCLDYARDDNLRLVAVAEAVIDGSLAPSARGLVS